MAPRASSSGLPINNPSYGTNPTLWHAIAMQQQRLAEMKIDLGAGPRRSRTVARRPQLAVQASTAAAVDDDDEDEDSPQRKEPTLTLAQRMGLAAAPDPELTPSEWDAIAAVSRDRGASREPCVICCEHFRDEKQVLLSCGHVFHRACLRSWERHSKSKVCPVCRKQHYRKHGIEDGVNIYRDECAVRLQAAWRGAHTRRTTDKALRHANPTRLRRYCERRLGGLTDDLLGRLEAERSAVDELFAEIDSSVAASRVMMGEQPVDWAHKAHVARARGLGDCPVCLTAMKEGEPLTLTSCTHVFHERCLASFERFSIKPVCQCPVCRAAYTKIRLPAPDDPAVAAHASSQPFDLLLGAMVDEERGRSGGSCVGGLCQECAPATGASAHEQRRPAESGSQRSGRGGVGGRGGGGGRGGVGGRGGGGRGGGSRGSAVEATRAAAAELQRAMGRSGCAGSLGNTGMRGSGGASATALRNGRGRSGNGSSSGLAMGAASRPDAIERLHERLAVGVADACARASSASGRARPTAR